MNIIDERNENNIIFKNIGIGCAFEWKEDLYLKIQDEYGNIKIVSLDTYKESFYLPQQTEKVKYVETELHLVDGF